MKIKKFVSLILITSMLLSMSLITNAQTIIHDGDSKHVTVTYGADMAFLVTIPSAVSINAAGIGSAEVTATNALLPVDRNLEVRVNGNDYVDKWELINSSNNTDKLEYFIYKDANEIENNGLVLQVAPGEAVDVVKSANLTFSVDGAPSTADSYIDTLTFTASLSAAIIQFTISLPYELGTKTYTAVDGWTWEDWLTSDYNTDDFFSEYSQYDGKSHILYEINESRWYIVINNTEYDKVFSNDTISRNHNYYTNR